MGSHLKSEIMDGCAFCLHFMPCLVIALIKGHESDCTSAQTFRLVEVCAGIDTEIWLLMMTCLDFIQVIQGCRQRHPPSILLFFVSIGS